MHEIVKYHNKLNNFNYGRFSAVEADIFFSLVAKIRNSDGLLAMTFDELKKVSNYYSRDEKRFVNDLEGTFTKYLNLKYREDDGKTITITNVFQKLVIAREKKLVIVEVTPGMEDAILSISENFTRFELQEFTNLKSSYSKSLYRLLKQWRTVGELYISADEFKFKLDIPKSYRQSNIDERIIKPATDELSAYFHNLKCRKEYKKNSSGRGRPAVVGFTFTFAPEDPFVEKKKSNNDRLARITGWEKIEKYCPHCYKEVYKKRMTNENGEYWLIGHPDFKTGDCKWTTTNFGDSLTKGQVQEQISDNEPHTDDEEENKKKLSSKLKGLFGR